MFSRNHANVIIIFIPLNAVLANDGSIAQRSPKLTVLMLDGCTLFMFDESRAEASGNAHGLNIPSDEKMKEVHEYLFARACAPNAEAADTGNNIDTMDNVLH